MRIHPIAALGGVIGLSLLLTGCASNRGEPTVAPRVIDARADEQLKRMTGYLAGLGAFKFDADVRYDDYLVDTQKVQFGKRVSVAVQRPDKAGATVDGDVESKRYWYDGKRAVILDVDRNHYSETAAPSTIDATLRAMAENYGLVLPLAELIAADSYQWLMNNVQSAAYVGERIVDGARCHHLAFEQPTLDWQIWIDGGEHPFPRQMLIAYKSLPNCPQYEARFTRWTPNASLTSADFAIQIPQGAARIELEAPERVVGTGTVPVSSEK